MKREKTEVVLTDDDFKYFERAEKRHQPWTDGEKEYALAAYRHGLSYKAIRDGLQAKFGKNRTRAAVNMYIKLHL